jgi:hypothetical protein
MKQRRLIMSPLMTCISLYYRRARLHNKNKNQLSIYYIQNIQCTKNLTLWRLHQYWHSLQSIILTTFVFAAVFSSALEPRNTQNKNRIQKLFRDQRSESIWLPHDWLTIRIKKKSPLIFSVPPSTYKPGDEAHDPPSRLDEHWILYANNPPDFKSGWWTTQS